MMQWSDKQLKLIHEGDDDSTRFVWAVGPVRSGKTRACIWGFLCWANRNYSGHSFLLSAHTTSLIYGNLVPLLKECALDAGAHYRPVTREKHIVVGTNRFYLFEALNESSATKLTGLTFAGALLDEPTLFPIRYIQEVEERCSEAGAKVWGSMNPTGLRSPFKLEYIDRAEKVRASVHRFRHYMDTLTSDNPHIDKAYLSSLNETHKGAWHTRKVEGDWADLEGLVYPLVQYEYPPSDDEPYEFNLAVDHATAAKTAALLIGRYQDVDYVIDEYYHDGRENGRIADTELVDGIVAMLAGRRPRLIVCDLHALSMKAELGRRFPGIPIIDGIKTPLEDGVEWLDAYFQNAWLRVSPRCENFISELGTYSWDSKAASRGEARPLKEGGVSDGPDAARYWCRTIAGEPAERTIEVIHAESYY